MKYVYKPKSTDNRDWYGPVERCVVFVACMFVGWLTAGFVLPIWHDMLDWIFRVIMR